MEKVYWISLGKVKANEINMCRTEIPEKFE